MPPMSSIALTIKVASWMILTPENWFPIAESRLPAFSAPAPNSFSLSRPYPRRRRSRRSSP